MYMDENYMRNRFLILSGFQNIDLDEFFMVLYDYVGFLSALKINRAGLNSLNVKKFQFNETRDTDYPLPIVKCTLHNTKNKKRIADVIEPWFVDQYYPRLMRCDSDDYIFMSKEKNRSKLYERIRKNFVRISSELGLYEFNGKTRPMYSIRHMNVLKLYGKSWRYLLPISNIKPKHTCDLKEPSGSQRQRTPGNCSGWIPSSFGS